MYTKIKNNKNIHIFSNNNKAREFIRQAQAINQQDDLCQRKITFRNDKVVSVGILSYFLGKIF